ncbi:MAG: NAD(P)-dependent oxidoreductase [Myxococcales bacterium]|nr:NAD(P)-dependent oxidoreductase [Myxococcales bacterium]
MQLENQTLLVTGPTSQVALPIVQKLAGANRVYGLARFSKEEDRERVAAAGATPIRADMGRDDLSVIPDGVDYVLHFAVVKSGDFAYDLEANAEGVGRLMSRCRDAKAFLHCSTAGVYAPAGQKPLVETDPLGDNHRAMMPTYSIAKIAAETVARFSARQWNLPTTIARFSVPYGDNGGWPWFHLMMMQAGAPIPVPTDRPALYNLIHEDDYFAMLPRLLEIASVPAMTVNWGGSEATSIEQWCAYLGELTGLEPKFHVTEDTIPPVCLDPTLMHEKVGRTRVAWRDGIRRMVEARNPELLKR